MTTLDPLLKFATSVAEMANYPSLANDPALKNVIADAQATLDALSSIPEQGVAFNTETIAADRLKHIAITPKSADMAEISEMAAMLYGQHVAALSLPSQPAAVGEDKRCVKWISRGVGSDLSGFVNSKAEGEFAVEIFGGMAWLDYRPSEPNWIQVKVDAPVPVLDALHRLVRANDNLLTPAIVAQALEAALRSTP